MEVERWLKGLRLLRFSELGKRPKKSHFPILPQQQSIQLSFSSPFQSKSNRAFEDLWCLCEGGRGKDESAEVINAAAAGPPDRAEMAKIRDFR